MSLPGGTKRVRWREFYERQRALRAGVSRMKPFLKWAGNKYSIIERVRGVLPSGGRLIEPFVGSGAVFLNTDYPSYLINDLNPDLIHLFQYLQKDGAAFVGYCKGLFQPETNNADTYYQFRELFNKTGDERLRAALFLYFNKHGYNGLCRFNLKGEFNVPFGKYTKPYFPEPEMLAYGEKLQGVEITNTDFATAMKRAKPGDVIYCDPPYVPLSETANFTSYSAESFGMKAQQELADLAESLAAKGVTVVISNHDTLFTQNAYHSAQVMSFKVQRFISCKGDGRGQASEVLALFEADQQAS